MKKMNLSSFKNSSPQKIFRQLWQFWVKYFRLFLMLFVVLAGFFVMSVWYKNLYKLDQVEENHALQLKERTKEVEFNEESFNAVVERIENRRVEFMKKPEAINDIFFPNQLPAVSEDQKAPEPVVEDVKKVETEVKIAPAPGKVIGGENEVVPLAPVADEQQEDAIDEDDTSIEAVAEAAPDVVNGGENEVVPLASVADEQQEDAIDEDDTSIEVVGEPVREGMMIRFREGVIVR